MEAQPPHPAEEIKRLQLCINDLVSVITLPSIWTGSEPSHIVQTLLEVLLNILPLEFVYVRLKNPGDEPPTEIFRLAQSREPMPQAIGEAFNPWLGVDPQIWPLRMRNPLGEGDVSIVPLRLGLHGEIGMIVAGSGQEGFPGQTERLILGVAANQAVVGLQEARLLSEQKRVARELDQIVAQRTQELSVANLELKQEMSEHERAEAARRYSEESYRVVVETASDAVLSMNDKGFIVFANRATAAIFGYDPTELTGKPLTVLMPDYMRELHQNGFKRYMATSERHINWQGTELTALRKNGEEFPVEVSFGEMVKDGHKIFTGFLRDISKRKQAEDGLRRALDERTRLSAVRAEIGMALTRQGSLREVLQACAEALVQHLDAAFARIWTLSTGGTDLELQASAGMYTRLNGRFSRIPLGKFKIGHIAEARKPHLSNDLQTDPEIKDKDWARAEKMRAFVGYPLVVEGRTVGVMGMFSPKPIPESILDTLSFLGDGIAQGIDRKRAEEKLRRSEAFLAEAQHLSQIGSYSWRVAADEITWSEQLYRIYELEIGMPVTLELIRSRVHPEDLTLYEKMVEQARTGSKDFEWQYRLLMPDHSVKYLHAVAHAARDQDGQLEYIAAIQDVTARRLSEEALDKARSQLASVARNSSLGVLTASIAHELNQPLSGIVTNASTCLRMLGPEPPNVDGARETARRTIRDANRASEVIARLRALYGRKESIIESVDLNEAAREVVALSLNELQRNRVILRPELAPDLPLVAGDRVQLQQVILNLLRNACDAMGGVEDRTRVLVIRTEQNEEGGVRLSVKDAGVGFDPQAAERLFEAFYTTKSDGMGIGLSVSNSIIKAHQGRLWATPNEGPGATFSFAIPCGFNALSGSETRAEGTKSASGTA